MESQHLKSLFESILFVASKPISLKEISKLAGVTTQEAETILLELQNEHRESGVVILESTGQYQMATHPQNAEAVKNFLNQDLREKLTDATVEVLAIIAYRQPISKSEIEAIRGVNSQYSIRHLLMRGMIEKVSNPADARGYQYQTTTEFLQHLGLMSLRDLPEFEELTHHIKLPETPGLIQSPDTETITPETEPEEISEEENMVVVFEESNPQEETPTDEVLENNSSAIENTEPLPEETSEAEAEEEDDFEDDEDEDEDEDEENGQNENAQTPEKPVSPFQMI